jgi:hypothetical protein
MDIHLLSLDWLMENAGPIIRWRVGNELLPEISESQRDLLTRELLATPLVQIWLGRLNLEEFSIPLDSLNTSSLGQLGGMVHGSKKNCLENVLGKLSEFGLCAGMAGLDERVLPLFRIFRWKADWKSDDTFQNAGETLVKSVFAWGLLRMGYTPDSAMQDFLLEHLRNCHKIAHDQVFDIYADEAELVGLPKAWAGKPIIKQEVMANYWLPYIHDLYVFTNFPASLLDKNTNRMIDDLITYILDPRFQALRNGYGYAWIKERNTCYSWGWSPHLKDDATLVQRVELMMHFPRGRSSTWVLETLRFLDGFRTPEARYRLPGEYLREAEGYYVSGYGMGLGENRRKSTGIEAESTFRMLKIQSLDKPCLLNYQKEE